MIIDEFSEFFDLAKQIDCLDQSKSTFNDEVYKYLDEGIPFKVKFKQEDKNDIEWFKSIAEALGNQHKYHGPKFTVHTALKGDACFERKSFLDPNNYDWDDILRILEFFKINR